MKGTATNMKQIRTATINHTNREGTTIKRDTQIKKTLQDYGIKVDTFNAHLLNEPWEVQNNSGQYFKVFTPYWRKAFEVYQSKKEKLKKLESLNILKHQEKNSWNFLPKKIGMKNLRTIGHRENRQLKNNSINTSKKILMFIKKRVTDQTLTKLRNYLLICDLVKYRHEQLFSIF